MYHERSNDAGFGSVLLIDFALVLVLAFLAVKLTMLIIHTLNTYPQKRILWVFLMVCVLSLAASVFLVLSYHAIAWSLIGLAGFLVCYLVELRNSQTFIKQPEPMVKAILGSSWWGDDTQKAAA